MGNRKHEALAGYLYILPSLLLLVVFILIPIFMSFFFSFTSYDVLNPPEFVGLANYGRSFKDPFIEAAIKNTLLYTIIVVPAQTVLSLVIAAVIAQFFRGLLGNTIKSVLFIPVIASMVLCGTVWSFLMSPESDGVLNSILGFFGLAPLNWLGRTSTAIYSLCIVAVWKLVGYFLVIYFAGIMDIPRSLYEAAEVDGATRMQQFFRITLPSLRPITFLVVTLGMIWSFQVFDLVYSMTGGGPGKSTVTLVLHVYTTAFREYNMGYASAISVLLLGIILVASALQKLLFREEKDI